MLSVQPDLVATLLAPGLPSAVVGNDFSLPVTWTVKNQGTFAPTENWGDNFYLSSKNTYDTSAVLVGSYAWGGSLPLAVGGSSSASTDLTIPNTALRGNQYLLVFVDQADSLDESALSNNTAAAPIQLTAPNVNLAVSERFRHARQPDGRQRRRRHGLLDGDQHRRRHRRGGLVRRRVPVRQDDVGLDGSAVERNE